MDFMNDEEYTKALQDNPQLIRAPDFITCEEENTRDFKYSDPQPEKTIGTIDEERSPEDDHPKSVAAANSLVEADQYDGEENYADFNQNDNHKKPSTVYFEAYDGDEEEADKDIQNVKKSVVEEATNVD